MNKLNHTKIKWIIEEKRKGKKTNEEIARTCKITVRRVQQLYSAYKTCGKIPMLRKNRRPKKPLTEEEKAIIEESYNKMFFGAKMLRDYIRVHFKKNINHNRIHKYLLEKGYAKENERKKRKRKRCRYERKHSLSLVHADWLEWNNKQVIAYQDDASRKILSMGEFKNASTTNSIKVLKKAEEYLNGYNTNIEAINTDRGSQFVVTKYLSKKQGKTGFQRYLEERGIKHIPSRRRNPQTNGKLERWVQEYKKHRHRFNSAEEFMNWYNNRMHGSLNVSKAETPNEAFIRKMRPEIWLGLFYKNVVCE
jgi:putative transposase